MVFTANDKQNFRKLLNDKKAKTKKLKIATEIEVESDLSGELVKSILND